MGTTIIEATFLDDGSSDWGRQHEHTAELTWHRTADMFSYTLDGEPVFTNMSIEEAETLAGLLHEIGVRPRESNTSGTAH